jgi:hypothetical protein
MSDVKRLTEFGGYQGDVSIEPLEALPLEALSTDDRIVAYGETSGHTHEVIGEVDAYKLPNGLAFMVAPDTDPLPHLVHTADHAPIEMTPGLWFVPTVSQVEYDGEKERRVMD